MLTSETALNPLYVEHYLKLLNGIFYKDFSKVEETISSEKFFGKEKYNGTIYTFNSCADFMMDLKNVSYNIIERKLLSLTFKPISEFKFKITGEANILLKDSTWVNQIWTETWGIEIDDTGRILFVSLKGKEVENSISQ